MPNPPLLAYRRCRNLGDLLVHNKSQIVVHPSQSHPCNATRCVNCKYMRSTDTFTSSTTGQQFKVNGNLSCTSSWVVYLITCRKCQLMYVGQTRNMIKQRISGHRSCIRRRQYSTSPLVAPHFNESGHSDGDFSVTLIEQITDKDPIKLDSRETFWIKKLKTLHPDGLNTETPLSL